MGMALPAPADPRVAHLLATAAMLHRSAIEQAVDAFIALLDARDPDADEEDDERGAAMLMDAFGPVFEDAVPLPPLDGLPGDPIDAEEDDDAGGEITDEPHDEETDMDPSDGAEGGSWPEVGEGKQHDALQAYDDDEREEDAHAPVERQPHRDRIRATRCRRTSNVYYPFALCGSPVVANSGGCVWTRC